MSKSEFRTYRKSGEIEARRLDEVTMIPQYKGTGSMTGAVGDWLARDPHNPEDWWIVDATYFKEHYEEV